MECSYPKEALGYVTSSTIDADLYICSPHAPTDQSLTSIPRGALRQLVTRQNRSVAFLEALRAEGTTTKVALVGDAGFASHEVAFSRGRKG